jgi:hypothetical protein
MRRLVVASLAFAAALAACSLFVKLDAQQCSVDADCAARGAAFAGAVCVSQVCVAPAVESGGGDAQTETGAPDAGGDGTVDIWACLSQPHEVLNPSHTIVVTITAFDALKPITTEGPQGSDLVPVAYSAVPGATVLGCNVFDPACASSVGSATTNDAGVATMPVTGDFVGFFRLSAPSYLPAATYPGQLLADASGESITTAMLGINELQLLAAALGVTVDTAPDSGVGQAFFEAYDCFDHRASGVTFTLLADAGSGSTQFYTLNGAPSTSATETDTLGAGGAVNVPVGALSVQATIASTQRVIATINPIISSGGTTFAYVRPRTR